MVTDYPQQLFVTLMLLLCFIGFLVWGRVYMRVQVRGLRFSLTELLIVSTLIAVALGVMAAVIRYYGHIGRCTSAYPCQAACSYPK